MNYSEFISEYNGKSFDYDGVSGVQCVDLIKMYLDKVFGIKAGAWGNAKDYYENFNNLPLKNSFERIANTPSFVPKKGDIAVWGAGLGNTYGHIAIATGEGNTSNFNSYDLNWNGKTVHKVNHTYKGFLGVLRPKDQSKIGGSSGTGELKTLARNTNLRNEPTTNSSEKTLYITNTTLYVLQAGVAQANGYTWDKVRIRVNGEEGYMINQNYK